MTVEQAHDLARTKGVSRVLYTIVRWTLAPFLHLYFRLSIAGSEHIPPTGAAIVTPNHKSFYDSFFIALASPRPMRFMGKVELFQSPWARVLIRLGAFPVRRGESDADALETAREVLRQGELLALFPEGTRIPDRDRLGDPRRGAARLALEAGAPIVPAAITGTDRLFFGPLPKPKRVQIAFAEPVSVHHLEPTPEAAGEVIEAQVWPQVENEFSRLISRPGLVAAGVAMLGLGGAGAALARRRGRARRSPAIRIASPRKRRGTVARAFRRGRR